jgi:AraC family transcriptional regulator
MQRFRLVGLSQLPTFILIGDGNLTVEREEWVQPLDLWTAIYYHHGNAVGISGAIFAVQPDTIVLFAPGVRATHSRINEDTFHHFLSFRMPESEDDRVAVPIANENQAGLLPSFIRAAHRIADDSRPGKAWIWNFLWSVARNPGLARSNDRLQEAEELIYRNISRNFTVPELAEAVGATHRTLLRAFREEHGVSIQQFVKSKRIQEATRLLTTTDRQIKDIALRVGIPDLQAFNKAIREGTGSSPTAFRELAYLKREGPLAS